TGAPGKGVFTTLTGSAPNRTFYVEWLNCRYSTATSCLANSDSDYEVVFQEGSTSFSIVYGTFGSANVIAGSGAIGVEKDGTLFTSSQCGTGAPPFTQQTHTYNTGSCLTSTATSTPT